MLTLVDSTNSNDSITPEAHGLYKLSLHADRQLVIETKPVFGANITLHQDILKHANFVAQPNNIIGWLDHAGLGHFTISQGPTLSEQNNAPFISPSQFFSADGGILRVISSTRIYLIATEVDDILSRGFCFFTPV